MEGPSRTVQTILYQSDDGMVMEASDLHLEKALEEYNGKVNELEPAGPSEELMEAYVNRGCILQMMEYRTSAMDDLQTASEILDSLETSGTKVDDGTFVRIHTSIAAILFDQNADVVEEYALAATRLRGLNDRSRHFDRRSIIRMCAEAVKNLLDSEYPEDTEPYLEKGMAMSERGSDAWTRNRRMELLNLSAEALNDRNDPHGAIERYAEAVDLGMDLMSGGHLEDPEELVMSLVMKAEVEGDLDLVDMYVSDMNAATTLLEEMMQYNRLDDPEVLVSLHHDLAGALMKAGRIQEAEKHLVRAMEIGVRGASDYINVHTRQ